MQSSERSSGVYMDNKKEDGGESNMWYPILAKCSFSLLTYPVEYVRVLMQLGYEPITPVPTRRLFGRPALLLPGAWSYMGYVRSVDGFLGLYRGFSAGLGSRIISASVFVQVSKSLPAVTSFEEDQSSDLTEEQKIYNFVKRTSKEMISCGAATIASHPLHVITIRCMAQFIGGEVKYSGVLGSLREIVHDEGIMGLFSGLVPRLLGEVVRIWLASTVAFFVNAYIVEDSTVQTYISATTSFLASSLTYPFNVVGVCMSVSGAPIEAGGSPHMARYESWTQCWTHLSKLGQLKRGSSLFWRYYLGPMIIDPMGVPRPLPINMAILEKLD